MDVPNILVEWISYFLHVKIGQTKSDWCEIKGGVQHGTKIGLLLFLCMISDFQPSSQLI